MQVNLKGLSDDALQGTMDRLAHNKLEIAGASRVKVIVASGAVHVSVDGWNVFSVAADRIVCDVSHLAEKSLATKTRFLLGKT